MGISFKKGIPKDGMTALAAADESPFTPKTEYNMYTLKPDANVFSAIPDRKLSVPSHKALVAKSIDIATPTTTATRTPSSTLEEKCPARVPHTAATLMLPSMFMFTIPALLDIKAAKPAKMIGIANVIDENRKSWEKMNPIT